MVLTTSIPLKLSTHRVTRPATLTPKQQQLLMELDQDMQQHSSGQHQHKQQGSGKR